MITTPISLSLLKYFKCPAYLRDHHQCEQLPRQSGQVSSKPLYSHVSFIDGLHHWRLQPCSRAVRPHALCAGTSSKNSRSLPHDERIGARGITAHTNIMVRPLHTRLPAPVPRRGGGGFRILGFFCFSPPFPPRIRTSTLSTMAKC